METIKKIEKEMEDIMKRYPSPDTTPREMLGHVAMEGNRLKVLKEQTESILKILEARKGFCNEYEHVVDDIISEIKG